MPFDALPTPDTIRGWTTPALAEARAALYRLCDAAPERVPVLLDALQTGRVDGGVFVGECRCIVGWLFDVQPMHTMAQITVWRGGSFSAAENLVYVEDEWDQPGICPGDTPANNPISALVETWLLAWQAERGAL